jgi:hypothetical protein
MRMASKKRRWLLKAFGVLTEVLADLPTKVGNVRIARLVFSQARGGCTYCFPHGPETTNSTRNKNRRSWKHHRESQYRVREAE